MNIEFKISLNSLNVLIFLNILIFIFAIFITNNLGLDKNMFTILGGLSTDDINNGALYQLVTANFLHIQVLHFIFNMYSLIVVGRLVDYFYGGKKLLITYVIGGIAASLLTYLGGMIEQSNILSLGASGSIFALVGLLIGGVLKKPRYGMDLPFSLGEILPFVIISLSLGFIPGSSINNWAHLGGLIAGILLGFLLKTLNNEIFDRMERSIVKVTDFIVKIILGISFITLLIIFLQLIIF